MVLCIAPTFFSAPLALLAGRLCKAKTWLHIQDFELDAALKVEMLPGHRLLRPMAIRFERFIFTELDSVSTISKNMLQVSSEKGVSPERARLLLNWVDTKTIQPLTEANPLQTQNGHRIQTDNCSLSWKYGPEARPGRADRSGLSIAGYAGFTFLTFVEKGPCARSWSRRPSYFTMSNLLDLQPSEKLSINW